MSYQALGRAARVAVITTLAVLCSCGSQSSPSAAAATTGGAATVVTTTSTPAPVPTVAVTSSPNGLAGEVEIADNFDPSSAIEPYPLAAAVSDDVRGAFRMTCAAGQISRNDPIVYPGQTGASHLHQFWGNTLTDASSTYESLRKTGDSTCGSGAPVNRTAYWMPAMLDGAGNVVKPDNIQIYYKQLPASSCTAAPANGRCVGLPNGLRLVFGYNMANGKGGPADLTEYDHNVMHYECWKDAQGTPALNGGYPTIDAIVKAGCPAGALLVIQFSVPPCWDGQHLDSADHRSHMAWGTAETGGQVCPSSHPYVITPWQGNIRFTTDANFVAGKWHLSSDEMMPNTVAGSTLHLDYFEAWSPAIKANWMRNCIDAHLSCADGQLGDGTHIRTVNLPPAHQLVQL